LGFLGFLDLATLREACSNGKKKKTPLTLPPSLDLARTQLLILRNFGKAT
jgi:hypothetical protein